jgi:uncharacterized protein YcbX
LIPGPSDEFDPLYGTPKPVGLFCSQTRAMRTSGQDKGMHKGTVTEVWRYPVSSVGGERLEQAVIGPQGVEGDRQFALFEAETGLAAAPEKDSRWRPALFLQAQWAGETLPSLTFPDGTTFRIDDRALAGRLKAYFGFDVRIGTYGREMQDLRLALPVVSARYQPSCLHIVTTASLARLATLCDMPTIDSRRFRPTLLVKTQEADAFLENDWVGQTLKIGDRLHAEVTEQTRRCGVTLAAQPGLAEEPVVLRSIMRHNARNLGIYAKVKEKGEINLGDAIYAET